MELIIMTFNLRLDTPSDKEFAWGFRKHRAIEMIKQGHVDILGTQEVLPSMLDDLKYSLDGYAHIGQPRRTNDEYSTIFYKTKSFKLIDEGTFWLSETPDIPESKSWNSSLPRICSWGCFESKSNKNIRFRVFNTHLDHISEDARVEGLKVIFNKMKELNRLEPLPVVLMGDFNDVPSSKAIQTLKETTGLNQLMNTYDAIHHEVGCTFHNFKGGETGEPIDYIFVSSNIRVIDTIVNKNKVDGMYPSDHYPVMAKLLISEIFSVKA